jgi:hypothetical protein
MHVDRFPADLADHVSDDAGCGHHVQAMAGGKSASLERGQGRDVKLFVSR